MGAEAKAKELGLEFTDDAEKGYLNMAARTGSLIITSGHTSAQKGKLGADVSVEQGYAAAKDVAEQILKSVHQLNGTLDGLRVVKLLGCELNHQLDGLGVDILGEIGVLYDESSMLRDGGAWQANFMFDLGLIIGGGTAQIQKLIIAREKAGRVALQYN